MENTQPPNDPLDNISTIYKESYPFLLNQLKSLPKSLDIIGSLPPETYRYLCIVGSRKYSNYGKQVCEHLIKGLVGYPIVIVSGLAFGIDSIAHTSALNAGLKTIAFPGSGLAKNVISPAKHLWLARKIVEAGGALISPFKRDQTGDSWTYPVRNALMAGISHATLIIEAGEKSGTLITANKALDFNRDVLIVPGSIFSPLSYGSHNLLKDGAKAVTCSADILEILGFDNIQKTNSNNIDVENNSRTKNYNLFENNVSPDEKKILESLKAPTKRDELIRQLNLPAGFVNALLIELELKGLVREVDDLLFIK